MNEEEVKVTVEEEKKPVKEKKSKGGKSVIVRIFDILLWVVILGWAAVCITDFVQVQREEKTVFCRTFEEEKYDDGVVRSCTGLGYKVFYYERSCYKAFEFGAFWSKDRSVEADSCK